MYHIESDQVQHATAHWIALWHMASNSPICFKVMCFQSFSACSLRKESHVSSFQRCKLQAQAGVPAGTGRCI